jgi:N-acetylglutamate synthase-like GNAT family acetyltransferase
MPHAKPTCRVRAAREKDLDAVSQFLAPFVADGRILPRTADELSHLLRTGFVAVSSGRVVGFVALEIYSRKLAELRSLCVAPEMQGRGIGRRLVERCLALARERLVFEVMAITSQDGFFRSCGFDFTLPGEKKALFLQTRDEH